MKGSKSDDARSIVPAESVGAPPRREFLSNVAKAAGGPLLGWSPNM